jgi:hypothetical protein
MSNTPNILPDSRPRTMKGAKYDAEFGWLVKVFCFNCGRRAGWVTEGTNVRHIAVLCDGCGVTYGAEGATYVPPDRVYFDNLKEAQLESYGRILSVSEVASAAAEKHGPLAALARDFRNPIPRG